jgi:putative acetyltransferase
MQNITQRRARKKDSEAITNILKETFEEYEINLPAGYSFSDVEKLEETYLNASGEFIVLTRAQRIIGFFALLPSSNRQVELKRLYLRANARGRGLGEYLLNLALVTAKQSGYDRMHLETTSTFFQAVALYRKFGFKRNPGANLSPGHDIGLIRDL